MTFTEGIVSPVGLTLRPVSLQFCGVFVQPGAMEDVGVAACAASSSEVPMQ